MDSNPVVGKEIAEALHKAQGEIKGAVKSAENPFFKSHYADLSSVWDACREALQNNGLSVTQVGGVLGEKAVLITRLIHTSGQFIDSFMPIICAKPNDPQAFGSAITYTRRYGLQAIIGICPTDDDGEGAMERGQEGPQKAQGEAKAPEPTRSSGRKITQAQAKRFWAIWNGAKKTKQEVQEKLKAEIGSTVDLDIPADKYDALCKWAESEIEDVPF